MQDMYQNRKNQSFQFLLSENIIQKRKIDDFMILRDIIFETNSIKLTNNKAQEFVKLAKNNLEVVKDEDVNSLLNYLADFSINRKR